MKKNKQIADIEAMGLVSLKERFSDLKWVSPEKGDIEEAS